MAKGLYANIHAKRKRIKAGSKEEEAWEQRSSYANSDDAKTARKR